MKHKRRALYAFNYIAISVMAYYSMINKLSIVAGVIMIMISFVFLLFFVAYIFSKEEGGYYMHIGSAILNTILVIVFFGIAILASAMHMPKTLYIISLILGVLFSINFVSVTNKILPGSKNE